MAGTLICRPEGQRDREAVRRMVEAVYGTSPADTLLPPRAYVVEKEARLCGYAGLHLLEGVPIGAVDWLSLASDLDGTERMAALRCLLEQLDAVRGELGLRAIMVHGPYEEIRAHLADMPTLQAGETGIRRLVATP